MTEIKSTRSAALRRAQVKYAKNKTHAITVRYAVTNKTYMALKQYTEDKGITLHKAIASFIVEALETKGFLCRHSNEE